jgi:hypothetical protein
MKKIIIVLSLLALGIVEVSAQTYQLEYKFQEGKTYLFREKNESN